MTEHVLSSVQKKWDNLCLQTATNRFHLDKKIELAYSQKGGKHSAQPKLQAGIWMKGKKKIIFVPDVPEFILQLAKSSTSQPQAQRSKKAEIVKQTMDDYTGFTKDDLEALLGIALNGILADQSQVGKGTIRPPSLPRPRQHVQTHPLGDLAAHQPKLYSQPQLGRQRWPEGLRVRSSWAAYLGQVNPQDEPSTLDLELAKDIASYASIIVVVGAGISVAAGSECSSALILLFSIC